MLKYLRRLVAAPAVAILMAAGSCFICGCHNEEKPAASSGYYSGSDYTKGGNPSLPGKGAQGGVGAQQQ